MPAELKIIVRDEGRGDTFPRVPRPPVGAPPRGGTDPAGTAPGAKPPGGTDPKGTDPNGTGSGAKPPAGRVKPPRDPEEERRAKRISRGLAWRKNKRREAWAARLADKEREAEEAKAEGERAAKEAEAKRAARVKRGLAWRKNKRREAWAARLKEREDKAKREKDEREEAADRERKEKEQKEKDRENERLERRERYAGYAGVATSAVLSGQPGALGSAGSQIGSSVGSRMGSAAGGLIGGAVGGPVGAMVGQALGDLLDVGKHLRAVGDAARFAGAGLAKVAQGDHLGAITTGLDAAAHGLEKIPIVGGIAAAGLHVMSGGLTAVNQVLGAFTERARHLGQYNGQIAGAAAMADVNRVMRDIREAQRMGDRYAKLIESQSKFESALDSAMMPIKEVVIKYLPMVLTKVLEMLETIVRVLDKMTPGATILPDIADALAEGRRMMAATRAEAAVSVDDLFHRWLHPPILGFPMPAAPDAPAPLGVPLVGAP